MSLSSKQRQRLEDEIQGDPLGRGYSGMSDTAALADLYTIYRTRNKSTVTGDDAFTSTDMNEFVLLSDGSGNSSDFQTQWLSFCGKDTIDAFSSANTGFVKRIFGTASQTVINLNDLRTDDITRAQELGLPGNMSDHQIKEARS